MTKVVNDLFDYGLKIVQDDELFKFSLDSILLAEFINIKLSSKKILDMCSGNVPIPLILSTKSSHAIDAIELQKRVFDLALETVSVNNLAQQINLINDDIKKWKQYFECGSYDIISCNPPYFKCNSQSFVNKNNVKSLARHEIKIKLCDILVIASDLLKAGGSFYLCHRVDRFNEIFSLLIENKFSISRVQFVYNDSVSSAKMVLIEAVKNGKTELKVLPPLFTKDLKSYKNIFEKEY